MYTHPQLAIQLARDARREQPDSGVRAAIHDARTNECAETKRRGTTHGRLAAVRDAARLNLGRL
jgi:hypothetical protein